MNRLRLPIAVVLAAACVVMTVHSVHVRAASARRPDFGWSDRADLTNDDVMLMVQNKLSDKIILTSIDNAASTAFDATPTGLLALKTGGVKDKIISEIQKLALEKQAPGPQRFVMTNDQVLLMVSGKVRLSEEIVVAAIQNAPERSFDVSPKGLIDLKSGGVNDTVIQLIQDLAAPKSAAPAPLVAESNPLAIVPAPSGPSRASTAAPAPAPSAPAPSGRGATATPAGASGRAPKALVATGKIPTEPGIYLYADDGKGSAFQLLEPTIYTAAKTGGVFKSAMTAGIAKVSLKASVRGAQASLSTSDASAEFYFVFENKQTQLGGTSMWGSVSSPNEFSLICFDVKSSTREVVVSQANAFGAQSGTQDKANVEFTSTKLAPGLYRVVPSVAFVEGQYAFMAGGSANGAAGSNRLFDFGVVK